MRKKILLFSLSALAIIAVAVAQICFFANKTDMDLAEEAEACFIYGDISRVHRLDNEELELIKDIFDGKSMYKDSPSCGFSTDISIKFNNSQTFCIACDTCPVVYWKEENSYIRLTEKEKLRLYDLLEAYGFSFPCV